MIGGLGQQIKEIKKVIELPIKQLESFESRSITQLKRVLLYGPPVTGRTLLARVVAHHTDCTCIRVCGCKLVQRYIVVGPWAHEWSESFSFGKGTCSINHLHG